MSLVFSGCKKENNDPQEPAQVQTYQMSITASKGADSQANGPRRVLSLDENTLNAAWQAGEQVSVYNATKGADLTGYLEAQTSGASTQLNGTLTGTIEAGDKLTLKYLSANYTGQNGTLAYISANCDYAVAENVEVESVDGSTIYTSAEATFVNQQAIVKFTLKNEDGSATIDAKPLVIEVAGGTYTVTPASATSEMFVALPGFENKTITMTATVGSDTYTYEKANTTLSNGQYYILTVKMTKQAAPAVPEGAISGKFSVSSTKQVYFAKGNLQFTRTSTSVDWSTGKFSFMDNQYDYIETNAEPYCTDDYADKTAIGLFGWATSNINTPVANTYYYPWETDNSSINRAKYGSGITEGDINWSDNDNAFANYDWGANTGDLGTGWRTLTTAEWQYLVNTRTVNGGTGDGKSYTFGQSVNGILGVVLYPDNYTGATYTTGSDWSKFEKAGCVFLPAAGCRNGSNVINVGSGGYYWSSTSYTYGTYNGLFAYNVYFWSNVNPAGFNSQYLGGSVRLVKNVE